MKSKAKNEPRCLKCGRPIESALVKTSAWEAPLGALIFRATGSFGSVIHDLMIEDICIEVIICDDCMKGKPKFFNITKA